MRNSWTALDVDKRKNSALAAARRVAKLPPNQVRDLKRVLNRACHMDAEGAMALETEACVRGFLDPATAKRIAGLGH